jgi:hypothetical protein
MGITLMEVGKYRRREQQTQSYCLSYKPVTKKSRSTQTEIAVQREFSKAQDAQGWKTFDVPIALDVEFIFASEDKTLPTPQQSAKYLLDLLARPIRESRINKQYLLYPDDSFVKLLYVSCFYRQGARDQVWLHARPINALRADLALVKRIYSGGFDGQPDYHPDSDLEELLARFIPQDRHVEMEENRRQYEDWMSKEKGIRKHFGNGNFELEQARLLKVIQEAFLSFSSLTLSDWAKLLIDRRPTRMSGKTLGTMGLGVNSFSQIAAQSRRLVISQPLALDLRHVRRGKELKEITKDMLERFKNTYPILFPLLPQVDLTLFLSPARNGPPIDLDNIALDVVGAAAPILAAPSTLQEALGLESPITASDNAIRSFHVVQLPRRRGDPLEGYVKVMVTGGELLPKSIMHATGEILDAWEKCVEI